MKKFIAFLLLIISVYFGARFTLAWTRPNSERNTRVQIEIAKGSSLKTIANKLEEKNLISDSFAFQIYSRWNNLATKYQAGEYIIPSNLTFAEIANDYLLHGKSSELKVTIPEGSTIKQIDEILAKKLLIEPGEFEKCTNFCDLGFRIDSLEGYLFPSTYYENIDNFSSKKFIQRLYDTFQQQLKPYQKKIAESGRTLNEIVIVASMIEREAFGDSAEEKALIADVIWKRLDERIHLGIDATTRYELNEWVRPLYTEDFAKNSPYNTRRKLGLPPTAISNPGIDSLKAAISPRKNDYYYYLHDSRGKIHFGKTLEEHNQNKYNYL
jgi:UPF0755 protein